MHTHLKVCVSFFKVKYYFIFYRTLCKFYESFSKSMKESTEHIQLKENQVDNEYYKILSSNILEIEDFNHDVIHKFHL